MLLKWLGIDALIIKQREWIQKENEILTYKHVNKVVRSRCVKHQAKRVDSRAILFLSATSVGALICWIFKQTNKNIAYQTNKLDIQNCIQLTQLQYILDH